MQPTAFTNAYFLQSLGWAIANSFWQAAIIWLIYKLILFINKELSAKVRYNFGVGGTILTFICFCYTVIQNYFTLSGSNNNINFFAGTQFYFSLEQVENILPYLSVIYLFLLGFYIIKFIKNYNTVNHIQNKGLSKASPDAIFFVKRTAIHIGIKKQVQVWFSKHVDVPSVIGMIKPVILLPVALVNQLTAQQLEAVLLHELVHIKRYDWIVNFSLSIIETILFFNPFIHLLNNDVKQERENCCDDWVINFQYNNHDYATALLILEEQRRGQLALALAATNGKKNLLNRIKRLFETEPQITISLKHKLQLAILGLLLLIGIFVSLPQLGKNTGTGSFLADENISIIPIATASGYALPATIVEPATPSITHEAEIAEPVINEVPAERIIHVSPKSACPLKKANIKKACTVNVDAACTITLINKDLLIDKQTSPHFIQVNNKETPVNNKSMIKVEEQESGTSNVTVYYFEVKDDSTGNINVTPLILQNKAVEKKIVNRKTITL